MRLPDHTQRLVERSLRSYCTRVCPPSFTRQVRLGWEIDADPHGAFWDRVNGASLRWCSSRGRCADCDHSYARIRGNDDGRAPCGP